MHVVTPRDNCNGLIESIKISGYGQPKKVNIKSEAMIVKQWDTADESVLFRWGTPVSGSPENDAQCITDWTHVGPAKTVTTPY